LIAGQTLDVYSKEEIPTPQKLNYINAHKTGDLICAAVIAGAVLGGATETQVNVMREYGENFGFAFQLRDDISDRAAQKKSGAKTYIDLFGLEKSATALGERIKNALSALDKLDKDTSFFRELALGLK
jgi:geranylgeranyl diphosphate synthase type II